MRGCCRCHGPRGSRDPGDWAVMPGGRFHGALCVAATGVVVGVAVVSSNQRTDSPSSAPVVPGSGICRAIAGSSSLDTAPVTGSLLFTAPVCCLIVPLDFLGVC